MFAFFRFFHDLKFKSSVKSRFSDDDFRTARAYLADPTSFIRTFTVTVNGKKRHIVTYTSDVHGLALRSLHKHVADFVAMCYTPSPDAYAYRKKRSVRLCVDRHLYAQKILKSDIHAFFDSIDCKILLSRLAKTESAFGREYARLSPLVSACFYDGKLPIGFVSSPVLSDFYLSDFDRVMAAIPDIVYTRYADDFIISGKNDAGNASLIAVRGILERELRPYGLSVNDNKTYIRELRLPGDAIHVLGLNIVRTDGKKNRVTVSNSYLRRVSLELAELYETVQSGSFDKELCRKAYEKVAGEIHYIYDASLESYERFGHLVCVKFRKELDLGDIEDDLCDALL